MPAIAFHVTQRVRYKLYTIIYSWCRGSHQVSKGEVARMRDGEVDGGSSADGSGNQGHHSTGREREDEDGQRTHLCGYNGKEWVGVLSGRIASAHTGCGEGIPEGIALRKNTGVGQGVGPGRAGDGRSEAGHCRPWRKETPATRSQQRLGPSSARRLANGGLQSWRVQSGRLKSGRVQSGRLQSGRLQSGRVQSWRLQSGRLQSGRCVAGCVPPAERRDPPFFPLYDPLPLACPPAASGSTVYPVTPYASAHPTNARAFRAAAHRVGRCADGVKRAADRGLAGRVRRQQRDIGGEGEQQDHERDGEHAQHRGRRAAEWWRFPVKKRGLRGEWLLERSAVGEGESAAERRLSARVPRPDPRSHHATDGTVSGVGSCCARGASRAPVGQTTPGRRPEAGRRTCDPRAPAEKQGRGDAEAGHRPGQVVAHHNQVGGGDAEALDGDGQVEEDAAARHGGVGQPVEARRPADEVGRLREKVQASAGADRKAENEDSPGDVAALAKGGRKAEHTRAKERICEHKDAGVDGCTGLRAGRGA
eukprot:scaffold22004_cov92-Isochrysis_galbana.AAC.1